MTNIKFIFVGESQVGKTSLITQYLDKTYSENYIVTVGRDKTLKNINIGGKEIKLEIFDTAGQPDYRAVNKIFMKNTDIALIVYDITNRKTFEELTNWIYSVKESNQNKDVVFGIAANKSDLFEQKVVNKKEGEEFAEKNNLSFFETTAKDYNTIEKVFIDLTKEFLKKKEEKNKEEEKQKQTLESDSVLASIDENFSKEIEDDPCCSSSKCYLF